MNTTTKSDSTAGRTENFVQFMDRISEERISKGVLYQLHPTTGGFHPTNGEKIKSLYHVNNTGYTDIFSRDGKFIRFDMPNHSKYSDEKVALKICQDIKKYVDNTKKPVIDMYCRMSNTQFNWHVGKYVITEAVVGNDWKSRYVSLKRVKKRASKRTAKEKMVVRSF